MGPGLAQGALPMSRWSITPRIAVLLACWSFHGLAFAENAVEPSEAPSVPNRLTLDEALRLARTRGFGVQIAAANVGLPRADVISAGAPQNPTLGFGVAIGAPSVCSSATGPCSANGFQASLTDNAALATILVGKRPMRVRVAELTVKLAELQRDDALRTLEYATKVGYSKVAIASRGLKLQTETIESLERTLSLVTTRYRAGAVSEADVAKIETVKLEAEQAKTKADAERSAAEISLSLLVGSTGAFHAFEVDDAVLDRRVAEQVQLSSRRGLVAEAISRRPDLQGVDVSRRVSEARVSLEKLERTPDIALVAQYNEQGSGSGVVQPPTLTLGVSAPLPLFTRREGEIAHAEAERRVHELEKRRLEASIGNDVDGFLVGFQHATERLDRVEHGLLDRARRVRELVATQYERGAASSLELLDAERTLIAANQEYLAGLDDYWTAVFGIEAAIGRELHR